MPASLPTVRVHGLNYVDLSPDQLRVFLAVYLRTRHGMTVFTPNAQIGAACRRDPSLLALIRRADLVLPDGAGVLLASRRTCPTHPLRYRLPGIDTGETVLYLCADMGLSVYFLGGRPHVAEQAAQAWQKKLPTLNIVGTHDGYFEKNGDENNTVIRAINQSGADVVFVCLGFPLQEQWIIDNRASLPYVHLFMGLGGSFDVWAGRVRRAPRMLQRTHTEWLWRMLAEPRRLLGLPPMLKYVFATPNREK